MDTKETRKFLLWIFIAFLALTAIIAIISVLAGDFGEIQLKVLATTSTISAASICSMSCAAFIGRGGKALLGFLGIVCAVAAAVLAIAGMWPEIDSKAYWKTTLTFTILAIALAHAFLLLLPKLDQAHRWAQTVSIAAIGILSLQLIAAAWGEINDEDYYRFVTVVAIIVGLATLVVPVMMKLRKGDEKKQEKIVLEKVKDDLFKDASGKLFRVNELGPDEKYNPG